MSAVTTKTYEVATRTGSKVIVNDAVVVDYDERSNSYEIYDKNAIVIAMVPVDNTDYIRIQPEVRTNGR